MKIGVLTSSRADSGIYKLLLSKLSIDDRFDLTIIVFGMHLQKKHGETIKEIESDGFGFINKVHGMPTNDMPLDISKGYGKLIIELGNRTINYMLLTQSYLGFLEKGKQECIKLTDILENKNTTVLKE